MHTQCTVLIQYRDFDTLNTQDLGKFLKTFKVLNHIKYYIQCIHCSFFQLTII